MLQKQLHLAEKLASLDAEVRFQKDKMVAKFGALQQQMTIECAERCGSFLQIRRNDSELSESAESNVDELAAPSSKDMRRRVVEACAPEWKSAELSVYRQHVNLVHALERLDVQVLELPRDELKSLVGMGFKLYLAESVRRTYKSVRDLYRAPIVEFLNGTANDLPRESSSDVTDEKGLDLSAI